MCGIVAAVGHKNIVGILLEGLRKLEYRGYDSAGVAVLNGHGLVRVRSAGRVADLTAETEKQHLTGETGIAHTRWATHGAPCE
ncbi:MAG: glutamine--fructose-6-phosphate aminotransferase, partial [Fluviibacter sp.]